MPCLPFRSGDGAPHTVGSTGHYIILIQFAALHSHRVVHSLSLHLEAVKELREKAEGLGATPRPMDQDHGIPHSADRPTCIVHVAGASIRGFAASISDDAYFLSHIQSS